MTDVANCPVCGKQYCNRESRIKEVAYLFGFTDKQAAHICKHATCCEIDHAYSEYCNVCDDAKAILLKGFDE